MITIIVPVYNSKEYLDICIKSILLNTFWNDFRVVIVDDNSFPPIENNYNSNKVHLIRNDTNKGFPISCNIAIKEWLLSSDYICILNNDTVVTCNWLNRMISHMNMREDTGIVGPYCNNISGIQQKLIDVYENYEELNSCSEDFYL